MESNSDNPFASPTTTAPLKSESFHSSEVLAGRFTRFCALFVDGLMVAAISMPIFFLTGYFQRAMIQEVSLLESFGMSLVGLVVFLSLHGFLLVSRGQTIGKFLTGIQIIDHESPRLLGFVRVYIFRYLWTLPIVCLVLLIPGTADDFLLNIVNLIDALLIFGVARRCLHDYIAGSRVVLYQEGRKKLAESNG